MVAERVVPVVVKVQLPGSSRVHAVRVGQAHIGPDEVVLSLEPLAVQLAEGTSSTTVHQARGLADLEWMAQRSRRILEDPKKERWHADMRRQLELIEAEMTRLKSAAHH